VGTNTTDVATCAFVLANAGSGGLLASTNVWTGVSNTFNNVFNTSKINVIDPTATCSLLDNLTTGNLNIADNQTAGVLNIGQNKTGGWVLLGSASVPIIIKGTLSCEQNINLGNATSTEIYSTNAAAPFQIRGDNTLNVIGSGLSKFGSWNNGNVELATQSFSNVTIGSGGTGGNIRTTTIKGTLIATGSGGPNTTLWGLISSEFKTTSLNYQIPTGINRDYTLIMITSAALDITLPAVKLDQVIHIRNRGGVTLSIKIPAGVTLYPVGLGGQTTSWSLTSNQSLNIISDGVSNWYGF
jgi:hypothetical protein